jgi:hypothetical protein
MLPRGVGAGSGGGIAAPRVDNVVTGGLKLRLQNQRGNKANKGLKTEGKAEFHNGINFKFTTPRYFIPAT